MVLDLASVISHVRRYAKPKYAILSYLGQVVQSLPEKPHMHATDAAPISVCMGVKPSSRKIEISCQDSSMPAQVACRQTFCDFGLLDLSVM